MPYSGIANDFEVHSPRNIDNTEMKYIQASTAIGSTAGSFLVVAPNTSLPSQNLGSSFPGMNMRSTPPSVMTHMRIVPPDEPSRDMASARAVESMRLALIRA